MSKQLEDMSYPDLVDHVAQQVHSALLTEGGKGLKSALYVWLGQAIIWKDLTKEKEKKKEKK